MSQPSRPRPLIRHLALAGLALLGACGRPEPSSAGLFTASVLTAAGRFTAGIEGPACDAAGNVLAVNFARQGTIGRVDPDGRGEVFAVLPEGSVGNGLRIGPTGTLFVADYTGHSILTIDPVTRFVRVLAHEPAMSQPNDLALGPDGTLYASDPDWTSGTGRVWKIGRDGKAGLLASGLGTTNGIEVSPDGGTLYVNESDQRKIWAYTLSLDGVLAGKRLLAAFPD